MKIVSYNVNGIRAAMNKGFVEWLTEGNYDIVCVQETKALREQVETGVFDALGYHQAWHSAEKKGYSGTATFSKIPFQRVITESGLAEYDREGRILRTDFENFTLLNCYFPSGTSGDERQDFKISFLTNFLNYIENLKKEQPNIIVVGDYNIAHNEIDIHDPKSNKNNTGFLPEERAWMTQWFESGFADAFRTANPDKVEYSWWSYRANARANNKGWRIDYQSVSNSLKAQILNARQLPDAMHSDHCPVLVEYAML